MSIAGTGALAGRYAQAGYAGGLAGRKREYAASVKAAAASAVRAEKVKETESAEVEESTDSEAVNDRGSKLADRISGQKKAPYSYLADEDGNIEYNGVTFVCDYKTNSLCLGDMSDKANVLNIPLSGGGSLKVNRDNIGDLSKAIGMFSPEDINRIMRAIALDNKIRQMKLKIEEDTNSIGEGGGSVTEEEAAQDSTVQVNAAQGSSAQGSTAMETDKGSECSDVELANAPEQMAESTSQYSFANQVDRVFEQAPSSVWEAWLEAWLEAQEEEKERSSDIYGSVDFGDGNYITQVQEKLLTVQTERKYAEILGDSKESAQAYVQQAIENLEQKKQVTQHQDECERELKFYKNLRRKLAEQENVQTL